MTWEQGKTTSLEEAMTCDSKLYGFTCERGGEHDGRKYLHGAVITIEGHYDHEWVTWSDDFADGGKFGEKLP